MQEVDPEKLQAFVGRMVNDMGAAASGALVLLGDRLGLFKALAKSGSGTSAEIAAAAGGLDERYVREWLSCMAASGYVDYDPAANTFLLSPEQSAVFADPDNPFALTGAFWSLSAVYHDEPKIADAFRTGRGFGWEEHHPCLFCGTAKFFRPGYAANLVSSWLPALEGVIEKLQSGARVADVGCGHGCSTEIMARAFPNSEFKGFDVHGPSIEAARESAAAKGLANLHFETAKAKTYPGAGYDLVAFFDCLHDMGDPTGAARHVLETLKPGGTWLIVEPMAGDSLAENLNPVSRVYYAFSTMVCTPASRSQEVGAALGAQAGEKRLREAVTAGGFTRFRRAAETPFNLILEARP